MEEIEDTIMFSTEIMTLVVIFALYFRAMVELRLCVGSTTGFMLSDLWLGVLDVPKEIYLEFMLMCPALSTSYTRILGELLTVHATCRGIIILIQYFISTVHLLAL